MPPPAPDPGPALPPQYDPGQLEQPAYERWVAAGYFAPRDDPDAAPFCIVIPPPNVTGSLHIGHAFEHTLIDALTRRRRMQGYAALWLPGMDHAGIATQNAVERQLAGDGLSRHDLGRERFVERVWQWKAEYGGRILHQMRRLGASVDWTRERFTMDEGLSRAVLTMFARLYDDGLIYRAERIINWCPRCLTALSDIEVEHTDDEGELVSIRYGPLTVATTRVETMLGDTAVAVHPDDERYRHLVGTEVELPLTGRRIPVVADAHVDPEFGTGAVKVTPAHDPNDFEIARRHDLPAITIMDERGTITAAGPFEGLDRFEARPAVTAALRELGVIAAEQRPYLHAVGHCSRCRTVVEPRLSLQWFIRVAPLAKAAGDAVRDGRVTIHPTEQHARWFGWVDDMHDWCISRQLWWGHRIPVWYSPDGTETVCVGPGESPPDGWTQDPDVLDTWFSSGLWPFSTLGWPDATPDLDRFYPTSVLVTGYDILFFWVARMMMFGLYAMGDVPPFRTVVLHGMVRDGRGRKMSKTAGNVVDPLEWVDRFGADAVRFTLARGANPGADVPVSEEWVAASRNFATKLWNGVRFAMINGARPAVLPPRADWSTADGWVLSRLAATVAAVDELFENFEFGKVAETLFHFAWDEVFDWYLELAKAPLAAGGRRAEVTRAVLGHVLDTLLRLLHPLMPFVTEELWRTLTGGESLVVARWPDAAAWPRDEAAERDITALQELVTEVRRFRADQGVRATSRLAAVVVGPADADGDAEPAQPAWLAEHASAFAALARLDPVTAGPAPAGWPLLTAAGVTLAVQLSGAVDAAAERARLGKQLAAAAAEAAAAEAKLANPQFVAKAPGAVVAKMRGRRQEAVAEVARLTALLAAVDSLDTLPAPDTADAASSP